MMVKKNEYNKDFIKIKFDTDDNLSINKTLKFHNIAVFIESVFEEHGKFYHQVYLDECLYELVRNINARIRYVSKRH